MIETINRARTRIRTLDWIDAGLQAGTVLLLAAVIVAIQADVPAAFYLLALPVAAIAIWAFSGLLIDRQALRREQRP